MDNNPEINITPAEPKPEQKRGKYTKEERAKFAEYFGPGAPIAIESLRKVVGIRIQVTKAKRIG